MVYTPKRGPKEGPEPPTFKGDTPVVDMSESELLAATQEFDKQLKQVKATLPPADSDFEYIEWKNDTVNQVNGLCDKISHTTPTDVGKYKAWINTDMAPKQREYVSYCARLIYHKYINEVRLERDAKASRYSKSALDLSGENAVWSVLLGIIDKQLSPGTLEIYNHALKHLSNASMARLKLEKGASYISVLQTWIQLMRKIIDNYDIAVCAHHSNGGKTYNPFVHCKLMPMTICHFMYMKLPLKFLQKHDELDETLKEIQLGKIKESQYNDRHMSVEKFFSALEKFAKKQGNKKMDFYENKKSNFKAANAVTGGEQLTKSHGAEHTSKCSICNELGHRRDKCPKYSLKRKRGDENKNKKVAKQCHFYQKASGCRHGDACKFLHETKKANTVKIDETAKDSSPQEYSCDFCGQEGHLLEDCRTYQECKLEARTNKVSNKTKSVSFLPTDICLLQSTVNKGLEKTRKVVKASNLKRQKLMLGSKDTSYSTLHKIEMLLYPTTRTPRNMLSKH